MARKVKSLEVQNIKSIQRFKLIAKDGVNEIAGDNEVGKTTLLDIPRWLMEGKKALSKMPLRQGADKGGAQMVIDGFRVILILSADKEPTFKIQTEDGLAKGNQTVMQSFVNAFTFDPLAFTRMKRDERVKTLRQMAGKEWCDAADRLSAALSERTVERTEAKSHAKRLGEPKPVEVCEAPDTAALLAKRKKIEAHNAKQIALADKRAALQHEIDQQDEEVADIKEQIAALQTQLASAMNTRADAAAQFLALPIPENELPLAEVDAALATATVQTKKAQAYQQFLAAAEAVVKAREEVASTDAAVKIAQAALVEHTTKLPLPVPGLAIRTDDLYYEGIPWEELSDSRRLRISVKLAMAYNPELRCLFIDNAESLDKKSYKEVEEMALEAGYQVLMASVTGHSEDAVLISAGPDDATV